MVIKKIHKKANIIFILAVVLAVAIAIVAIGLGLAFTELGSGMDTLRNDMSATLEGGEVDDVEGYGLIVEGAGYGLGAFAGIVLLFAAIFVGGYAFLLFLFALIARLVYAKEGKRLLAYRILMGFEYVLQAGIFLFFCILLSEGFNPGLLVIMLLVLAELVYGVLNTFTKRICE